jgi:hypothetical protein
MKRFRDSDYYVTEDGDVYRLWKFKGYKKLKPHLRNGYLRISICKNGKRKIKSLNRLVAECYIPNPSNLPEVNHNDGNKINNNVSNLYWCTTSQNVQHAFDTGLKISVKGEKHAKSILTEQQIIWIRNNYIPRDKEFGCRPLSKKFNVSGSSIYQIINNRTWKHLD